MDWPGFLTFTAFISSLLLGLTFAAYGVGESLEVVIFALTSGASLFLFILAELRHPEPLLDLGLLRIREFTGGVLAQLVNAMAWGAFILLTSLYLQLVQGLSPLRAGLAILPFDIALLLVGPLSGKLSDRFGTRRFATAGLALVSVSLLSMSTLSPGTPYLTLVGSLVLGGAGMGLFITPNMSSIMGSVPAPRRGVASGLRATFFNIGFTLSFNVVILVLTFYLPYGLITLIISSQGSAPVSIADKALFASSLDNLFLVLSAINTAAIVPSLLRGKVPQKLPERAGEPGPEPE